MELNLEEIKAAARAATPGPWGYYIPGNSATVNPNSAAFLIGPPPRTMDRSQGFSAEDAAHIAAANPANVLALVARLELAERKNGRKHGNASSRNGKTPIYECWMNIRHLVCRGRRNGAHRVCHAYDPRWDNFENFLADFGEIEPNETIRRRSKQMPWSKGNCFVSIGRRV